MDESNKLTLRRVELSLTKFNEVAIPHHLDLLRQHKANIIKYEENKDYARVRTEQMHAKRVSSQLRSLLQEMEALRRQVRSEDLAKFDALTQRSRDLTLKSIVDYLETSPLSINRSNADNVAGSAMSTDSVGVVSHARDDVTEQWGGDLQLQVNEQEVALLEREALMSGWSSLQEEVRALHEAWATLHHAAVHSKEQVTSAEANIQEAGVNVVSGRQYLASAERLKVTAMGATGAILGALVGGPVGLVAGVKAGAACALAGSLTGYFGLRHVSRVRTRHDKVHSTRDDANAIAGGGGKDKEE